MRGTNPINRALSICFFVQFNQGAPLFEQFKLDGQNDSNLGARKKVVGVYITLYAKKKKKKSAISIATGLPPELLKTIQEPRKKQQSDD